MRRAFRYSAWMIVLLGVVAHAQQQGPPPPRILQIFEENVKVGRVAAHEKIETTWVKTWAAGKWPGQSLAMKTIAGPLQAWFITPHESMAAMEKLTKDTEKMAALTAQTDALSAQDGDLLTGVRQLIAAYREDLTYIPANAVPVPKLRYFDVVIYQVRPGHTAEFVESRKLAKAAHEKASMPDSTVYYSVVAGAPNDTFMRFQGFQSLADGERFAQAHSAKAYQDAVSASTKRIDELISSSVASTQHLIYELDPKISFMPKEFTSQDPDFWTPKPKVAAPTTTPTDQQKPKAKK